MEKININKKPWIIDIYASYFHKLTIKNPTLLGFLIKKPKKTNIEHLTKTATKINIKTFIIDFLKKKNEELVKKGLF